MPDGEIALLKAKGPEGLPKKRQSGFLDVQEDDAYYSSYSQTGDSV